MKEYGYGSFPITNCGDAKLESVESFLLNPYIEKEDCRNEYSSTICRKITDKVKEKAKYLADLYKFEEFGWITKEDFEIFLNTPVVCAFSGCGYFFEADCIFEYEGIDDDGYDIFEEKKMDGKRKKIKILVFRVLSLEMFLVKIFAQILQNIKKGKFFNEEAISEEWVNEKINKAKKVLGMFESSKKI